MQVMMTVNELERREWIDLYHAFKQRRPLHWKSQGQGQASNSMGQDDSVFFPPNIAIIYEDGLSSLGPSRLHVPKARNQVAFDSFFILGQILYIFQFTLANNHDIKKRLKESLSGLLNILSPKGELAVCVRHPS